MTILCRLQLPVSPAAMLSRRLGVPGADSLPRLSLLLACRPLSATEAAFLSCSEPGMLGALSIEVRVACATASAAALPAGAVGVPALLLGLSHRGMSHTGICVFAMVVLPLLMYSLTSNSCCTGKGSSSTEM